MSCNYVKTTFIEKLYKYKGKCNCKMNPVPYL